MNRKAFTLIELLAVIVILGVVLVIAIPQTIKLIDKTKNNAYKQIVSDINDAAKTYLTTNAFKIDNFNNPGDSTQIKLSDLVSAGLLKKQIINPKTDKPFDLTSYITVTISSTGGYVYNYNFMEQSYYSDGLVMWLDGYDAPEGNLWKDKSNTGNDATINFTSSSGYNLNKKGYVFDGIDDLVTQTTIKNYVSSQFTATIILKTDYDYVGDTGFGQTIISIDNNSALPYPLWITQKNGILSFKTYSSTTSLFDYDISSYRNQTISITVSAVNNGATRESAKVYINDDLIKTFSTLTYATPTNINFYLGDLRTNRNIRYKGTINMVKIYNTILSDTNVKNNYSIDKIRYGL